MVLGNPTGTALKFFMPHSSGIVEHSFQQKQVPFLSVGSVLPQTFLSHFIQEELGLESLVSYSVRAVCSLGIFLCPFPMLLKLPWCRVISSSILQM